MGYFEKPPLNELMHYGMPRRSGRYPWGSGKEPYQHSGDFLSRVEELKKSGLKETEIAKEIGLSTTQLRVQKSLANAERRELEVDTAKGLREKGYSLNQIAEKMGYKNNSSIRSLLNERAESRMKQAITTANFLKEQIEKKGMIDIGTGVERELGVSREKLNQAAAILQMEGYEVFGGGVEQATNKGRQTNLKVLAPPGTEHKEIYAFDKVGSITEYTSRDDGFTFGTYKYPESMDSSRVSVRYAEDGGTQKDGLIELRRGVPDLSLGNSRYAQVRILVNGTHYIKGMAMYSDNLPEGKDIVFNTNKSKGTPMCGAKDNTVLKNIKTTDPNNPFGVLLKAQGQSEYVDSKGNKKLGLINKTREEGDWKDWSDKLPSQFLSKQDVSLIKKQLDLTKYDKRSEFEEIAALTNKAVKRHFLASFASDCDASAVHLKAAALPRQKYHVILPITSMKDNEVYAPNYRNGEKIALIRFPHGGTFEIPVLTVNNKHQEAKKALGNAIDAVGINSKVAERLSGADFDGDTVMTIPTNNRVNIKSTSPLKALEGFDAKMEYHYRDGMKLMKNTQTEMGKISNLITDMTIKGANDDELARAVKHSMVVIDAEKHRLDYKRSEKENGIASLKKQYQGTVDNGRYHEGAATLISRAKSEVRVPKTKGSIKIDPETGELIKKYDETPYVDKKGNVKTRTQVSTKMAEAKDARSLSFGTKTEDLYADYANYMKALANEARKELMSTGRGEYNSSASELYKEEVNRLNAGLNVAEKNKPRERKAQLRTASIINALKKDNPDLKNNNKELKKLNQQILNESRNRFGAMRNPIKIDDKAWEAIQAGAISDSKLTKILQFADVDELRQRATPRATKELSSAKVNKIKAMNESGYSIAEIADANGLSASTISKYLK
nr:MAG TPA: RNA dependent RNA polymerase [Bacteriophage sp.]